eukprot:Gb_19185 [translate_table: standard]
MDIKQKSNETKEKEKEGYETYGEENNSKYEELEEEQLEYLLNEEEENDKEDKSTNEKSKVEKYKFPKLDPLDGEEEPERELNSISSNEVLASERDEEITEDKVFEESLIFGPLSKADYMEQAKAIVLEKEENRHETPIDLYQTMTNGCTTIRDELKGLIIFQRLKEPRMKPSVISLGYRSHLYTKRGKVSKTLEVSKDIKAYGIEHNKKKYSTLINGYVQLNDCATASAIYEEMIRSSFKPDVVTYNIIENASCKSGNMN